MTAISVVIPIYNRADLIAETLAGVFAQTLPPDEIILVDDGSTDATPDVLASYGGLLRVIRVANGGDIAARNIGTRAARHNLVAFCDSDDLWRPEHLEMMAQQWRAVPEMVSCYGNFRILRHAALSQASKFDEAPIGYWDGLRPTGPESFVFEQPVTDRLLAFQPFFPSAQMVRRDAFVAAGGWDEGLGRENMIGADFATALRLAQLPPLGIVRQPTVAIRKHDGNLSADNQKMNLGDALVLEHVLRCRPELAPLREAIEASVAQRRRDALHLAFARHDFTAVRAIHALLPAGRRGAKEAAKFAIATLPEPLRRMAAALATR
jgi:glycosyltransferase involved in cell wall biosynthesis